MPTPSPPLTIRALAPTDVPSALRLSSDAGWNQREEDWRAAVGMTPGASFCAIADDRVVGTCIGIAYGNLSWIAMMLVDPAFRRRGLGADLLLRSIEALPPDHPVGLDATVVGRLLYEQHGFRDTCQLTRRIAECVQFAALTDDSHDGAAIRPVESSDLPEILTVDRLVFGGDRRRVLEWALSLGPDRCAVATIDGRLAGYVFGRTGRVFTHIGTVVARSRPVAQSLVRQVLGTVTGPVGIDAFDALPDWTAWLESCGFEGQRPLARMMRWPGASGRGADGHTGAEAQEGGLRMFSIFGPEFA